MGSRLEDSLQGIFKLSHFNGSSVGDARGRGITVEGANRQSPITQLYARNAC